MSYFRHHEARSSNWKLVALVLLAAFDLFLVGYLIHGIWVFAR